MAEIRAIADAETTKADEIGAALERAILFGELPPGTMLRQEQLAEQYGVSRTPIREALRRLDALGLVVFRPNRGVLVARPSRDELRQSIVARAALEGAAAELAATRISAGAARTARAGRRALRRAEPPPPGARPRRCAPAGRDVRVAAGERHVPRHRAGGGRHAAPAQDGAQRAPRAARRRRCSCRRTCSGSTPRTCASTGRCSRRCGPGARGPPASCMTDHILTTGRLIDVILDRTSGNGLAAGPGAGRARDVRRRRRRGDRRHGRRPARPRRPRRAVLRRRPRARRGDQPRRPDDRGAGRGVHGAGAGGRAGRSAGRARRRAARGEGAPHRATRCATIAPRLAADGFVVSLQNGLNEPRDRRGGRARRGSVGAFVNFGADYVGAGADPARRIAATFRIGELDGRDSDRVARSSRPTSPDAEATDERRSATCGRSRPTARCCSRPRSRDLSIADALADAALPAAVRGARPRGARRRHRRRRSRSTASTRPTSTARSTGSSSSTARSAKTHSGIYRDLAVRHRKTEVDAMLGARRAAARAPHASS